MALTLVMSVCCTSVFATEVVENSVTVDDSEDDVTVANSVMTFETVLLMSDTAITAPEVTFEYTISTGDIYGTTATEAITGATPSSATFSTSDALAPDAIDRTFTVDTTVDFSDVEFTTTGIYHYTLTAAASTVDGIVMDGDETREIYVYVVNGDYDSGNDTYPLVIENIVMTTNEITSTTVTDEVLDSTGSTKSSGFVNGYGIDPDEDPSDSNVDDSAYEDFTITVNVDGNMADSNKDFTIALTSTDGISDGTIFEVTDEDGGTVYIKWNSSKFVTATYDSENSTWTTGDDLSIALKDNETYTIHSVVATMEFQTTITDEDNYTIYSAMDKDATSLTGTYATLENTIETQETTNINDSNNYVPTYDLTIPETGVILEFLPFALMVLIAGGLVTLRVVKTTRKTTK